MRLGDKSVQWTSLLLVMAFVLLFSPSNGPVSAAEKDRLDEQLQFGIKMAKRGLWSEALFRFSKVLESRPGDVRVLNNMAVAYEAIGEFDLALEYYKRALEGDAGNRDLRRNYAQFVEFYESLRPEDPNATAASSASDETVEDGADAGPGAEEGAEPNAEEGAGESER